MQIPSIPPPLITNPLPQDVVAKSVVQIQAVAPLEARAVRPSPKSEKFTDNRDHRDKGRGNHAEQSPEGPQEGEEPVRGSAVNIDV